MSAALRLFLCHAAFAHLARDGLAGRQRLGQELRLPLRVAHHGAELLVFHVVGAELVAVRQQEFAAVGAQHDRFGQQAGARGLGQAFAHQEVAVAGAEVDRDPRGRGPQSVQDRLQPWRGRVDLVIAHPGVEDVAGQQQGAGAAGRGLQEGQEGFVRGGPVGAQVHVGRQPDGAGESQDGMGSGCPGKRGAGHGNSRWGGAGSRPAREAGASPPAPARGVIGRLQPW